MTSTPLPSGAARLGLCGRVALAAALALGLAAAAGAELRAGAARIDITPAADESLFLAGYRSRRGQGHRGIHDPIYARALVLDDGERAAAIVVGDLIAVSETFADTVAGRVAAEIGIPPEHQMIAATHTHGAPSIGSYAAVLPFPAGSPQARYVERVETAMVDAVLRAHARLEPARIGAGEGRANVNVNRRAVSADGSLWLGMDPDGPSDKTVAVIRVDDAAGKALAILVNYAVHGTGMGGENFLVTGDVPGATSHRVEEHLGDGVVALWTSGAAGDQCPLYDRHPDRFDGLEAVARLLGDEVIRVARGVRTEPAAEIRGKHASVTCPGRRFVAVEEGSSQGRFEPTDPVSIELSLLRFGDIVLAGVGGEVLTMIGQRFKREAGLEHVMMVTHAGGAAQYIPDDASFARISYEIRTSRLEPGCAEDAIVSGLLRLIHDTGVPER